MLALQADFLVVLLSISLTRILSLLLQLFEGGLLENLLEAATAVDEELLSELARCEIVRVGLQTLGLEIDLHDRGADLLTIELRVLVLVLGLTEDGLHHNVKDLIADFEVFGTFWVETLLREQLTVSNKHFAELTDLNIDVVLRDLIQNQAHLLQLVLACPRLINIVGSVLHEL